MKVQKTRSGVRIKGRFSRHLRDGKALGSSPEFERQQIVAGNTAMRSNVAEGDLAAFKQADQRGLGDLQEVRNLLRSQIP